MKIKPGMKVKMRPWNEIRQLNLCGIGYDKCREFSGKEHEVANVDTGQTDCFVLKDDEWRYYWPLYFFE